MARVCAKCFCGRQQSRGRGRGAPERTDTMAIPVALQMYTLRDQASADFRGALAGVARIGYAGVELAGTGGLTAPELAKVLSDLGLKCAGSHEGMDRLESDFSAVVDFQKEIGNSFVVIPWLAEERRKGAAGWIETAGKMTEIGHMLKEEGLQLCYHNHSFEFEKFDGQYGLDLLYANSGPDAVQAELDTYWVKHGGEDPIEYINRYAGRAPLIHIKDMAAGEDRAFAEIGEGILDMPGIFEAAKKAGSAWMIVEQDTCKRPPIESVKLSFDNIKKMGFA